LETAGDNPEVYPTVAARAAKRTGDGAHCAIIKGVMRHATIDHLIDQLVRRVALERPLKRHDGPNYLSGVKANANCGGMIKRK